MQQTFLFIEQSWLNPLLILWIVIGVAVLGWTAIKKGVEQEFWSTLPVFVVGGLIIKFVIPMVMVDDPRDGEGYVLAIRGYGFFLLIGVVSGVGLAMHRSRQLGLHPDVTLNLCFCLFACGIIGARLFYVIQYSHQFQENGQISFGKILRMTEGGLVVYGSIIGGALGGLVFLKIKKLPALPMLDILAPCMMLGLAIGRIGCLMNGCCWGGICDSSISIQFPEGSPPYARHVETGELFGMKVLPIKDPEDIEPRPILEVVPGSPADRAGIKKGELVVNFYYDPNPNDKQLPEQITYIIKSDAGPREVQFRGNDIPARSLTVHPVQIYSAINAFLVFLFLWFYFPSRARDGQVLGMLMIIYPIGRFLLEIIRSDELGQFGTEWTISQWTSVASILGGISLLVVGFFGLQRTESFVPPKNPNDSKGKR